MVKVFDFDRFKFIVFFLLFSYTGLRIISNSMLFYGHEQSLVMIFTEWLYWFNNMPIWWPSHFIIFIYSIIYIHRKYLN